MNAKTFAAVDLGASSGRVIACTVGRECLELEEIHRFSNDSVQLPDGLYWDILRLFGEVPAGLRGAASALPFTTIHQLAVEDPARLAAAHHLLLIPDLLAYWLTGSVGTEITNASTTELLDAVSRQWSDTIVNQLELRRGLLGELRELSDVIGALRPIYQDLRTINGSVPVIAVGSHDTASAVVGAPADNKMYAYICCGTWGLVGVEIEAPILTEASRGANFTKELGVDGRIRFLRNDMGLWLLQESLRTWAARGVRMDLSALLGAAAALPTSGPIIDVDQPGFLPPGDMPARIASACICAGVAEPIGTVAIARCILDGIAAAFAHTVCEASALSGRRVDVVHLVGGGAQNELLCRLTANACRLPIVAGPGEATALGDVLVQARAAGVVSGSLESLRALVRSTQTRRTYQPGER